MAMLPKNLLYNRAGSIPDVTGAPKRYISDKTDEGFTNVPLMSQRRHGQTDKG